MSSRAVRRVIFSRLHAQFTRFLSISLIYCRYSLFTYSFAKMFTRQPPYGENSSAADRSKTPARIGLLIREEWTELWNILVFCWSTDPLDRPTASELEASLRNIFQPLQNGSESWFQLYLIVWRCIFNICYKSFSRVGIIAVMLGAPAPHDGGWEWGTIRKKMPDSECGDPEKWGLSTFTRALGDDHIFNYCGNKCENRAQGPRKLYQDSQAHDMIG